MPGSIVPLPVMVEDEEAKKNVQPELPKTVVVRYGYMKLIAELPFDGSSRPGCGTKLVIRSSRGIELASMLTSTCPNGGCGHSLTRKDMLAYIEKSGGKNYPFSTQGKVLRVATAEDMAEQSRLDGRKTEIHQFAKQLIREMDLPMKLVEVELLLGGERIIFHYTSDQWVDFRELVRKLASELQTRIEMHQVNARDEARLVADYEKCGQHCCCKQFLKVLKPVSMRAAKTQKATLDPSKISGRCGRLMCCLRYEEQTYDQLRKNLPHRQTRMMTDDGPGTVIDTQILTQLALVRLDGTGQMQAYPIEQLRKLSKEEDAKIKAEAEAAAEERMKRQAARDARRAGRSGGKSDGGQQGDGGASSKSTDGDASTEEGGGKKRRRRRRKRRGRGGDGGDAEKSGEASGSDQQQGSTGYHGSENEGGDKKPRKRRRRRRRRGGGGGDSGGDSGGGGDSPGGGSPG